MSATRVGSRQRSVLGAVAGAAMLAVLALASPVAAQTSSGEADQAPLAGSPVQDVKLPAGVTVPAGYVIGAEDVLSIVYWRESDLSAETVVRPDGMISLPLLNDVAAAGRTPEELRQVITERAAKFVEEPTVSVVVQAINSRKVFIVGQVARPNAYPLGGAMRVVQLITMAGGLQDWAKTKEIVILREENGKQLALPFNYHDILRGRNLHLNIELKPGDTIMVP